MSIVNIGGDADDAAGRDQTRLFEIRPGKVLQHGIRPINMPTKSLLLLVAISMLQVSPVAPPVPPAPGREAAPATVTVGRGGNIIEIAPGAINGQFEYLGLPG